MAIMQLFHVIKTIVHAVHVYNIGKETYEGIKHTHEHIREKNAKKRNMIICKSCHNEIPDYHTYHCPKCKGKPT